jgi:hypothetical protein
LRQQFLQFGLLLQTSKLVAALRLYGRVALDPAQVALVGMAPHGPLHLGEVALQPALSGIRPRLGICRQVAHGLGSHGSSGVGGFWHVSRQQRSNEGKWLSACTGVVSTSVAATGQAIDDLATVVDTTF